MSTKRLQPAVFLGFLIATLSLPFFVHSALAAEVGFWQDDGTIKFHDSPHIKGKAGSYIDIKDVSDLCGQSYADNQSDISTDWNKYKDKYNAYIHTIRNIGGSNGGTNNSADFVIYQIKVFDKTTGAGFSPISDTKVKGLQINNGKLAPPYVIGCYQYPNNSTHIELQGTQFAVAHYRWKDSGSISTTAEDKFYIKDSNNHFVWQKDSNVCQEFITVSANLFQGTLNRDGKQTTDGCKWNQESIIVGRLLDAAAPAGSNTPPSATASAASNSSSTGPNFKCQGAEPFNWILCPLIRLTINAVDDVETDLVLPLLKSNPMPADSSNNVYVIWGVFRNLADVGFVLAFIVVIFANTLSIGIDAYTVKKMLPRLVAAVIAVQLSFVAASALVDLSNVLGIGLADLIEKALPNGSADNINLSYSVGGLGFTSLIGGSTAGILAIIGGGGALLGAIGLLLLSAFIAVLGVFFTLMFRKVAISLLIILAPLAFVAWILPNTEQFFKKWYLNFLKILMMFPLIVLIIEGGKLVAIAAGAAGGEWSSIYQLAALIVPLFMIPATLKMSGTIMGTVGGAILARSSGYGKKVRDSELRKNLRADAKRKSALAMESPDSTKFRKIAGRLGSGNLLSFGKTGSLKRSSTYSEALDTTGKLIEQKLTRDGIAGNNGRMEEWYNEPSRTHAEKVKALQMLGDNNGIEELSRVYEGMRKANGGEVDSSLWKEGDKALWQRGTINARGELAKTLPYSVRPDGDKSIAKLNAEQFVSMKSAAGEHGHITTAIKTAGVEGKTRILQTMVNIGQSTDRRGRMDRTNALAFKNAATSIDPDIKVNVAGEDLSAQEFADRYIKDNGEMIAVPELSTQVENPPPADGGGQTPPTVNPPQASVDFT